jgi:hypothetical protein
MLTNQRLGLLNGGIELLQLNHYCLAYFAFFHFSVNCFDFAFLTENSIVVFVGV